MTLIKRITIYLTIIILLGLNPVWAQQSMTPEITISALDNEQHEPHVAYNSLRDQYLVVWHNVWGGDRDIYGQRLDGQGNVLSWFSISSGAVDRRQPAVAYDSVHDRYLVVWTLDYNGDGSDWDVYGRLIPWNGPDASLTEFPIETSTAVQTSPEVAFSLVQQEFLVVWEDDWSGFTTEIAGRRVAWDGTFPTGSIIPVMAGGVDFSNPDVAFNLDRNEYLVTYDHSGSDIFGTRFTATGVMLGGGEFGIAEWPNSEMRPSVAACGGGTDRYFVAWQSLVGASHLDVYGRFVTGDGVPDGAPFHFSPTTIDEMNVDVACQNRTSEYFVVFQQEYTNGSFGLTAHTVSSAGTASQPIFVRQVWTVETGVAFNPQVIAGDTGFLTVWSHERQGTAYRDIHGRIVWGSIFSDGFESGNTSAWSSSSP